MVAVCVTGRKNLPVLVPVHDSRCEVVDVCAGADQEQQHQEERLEVEKGRLYRVSADE